MIRLFRPGFLFGLVLAAAAAGAQEVGEPACPKEPVRFVVLGDSLADGLWGAIFRSYARCKSVETLRLTEVSDGLAKTSAEGWLARYATAATDLDTRQSDVVIVQMGANDITTIREGRVRESFASDTWNTLYEGRVAQLTRGLSEQAAQVFWFGLPIVGKSRLEDPYRTISTLQKTAVAKSGGTFVDIHQLTTFGTGEYAQNGTHGGRLQQLRASDKVHFTKAGYDFVAAEILDDLARITQNMDRRAALQDVQLQ